jgi:hypothetical protein
VNLYSIHDPSSDWASIIRDGGVSGWAVISESISDNPADYSGVDYTWLDLYNVTPIVRLNYSHHGEGTIPLPDRYDEFAARCANFVVASAGCTHWVIGNEPNLSGERPGGIPIMPDQYARCFTLCRNAIKLRGTHHRVIPAAIAPYNADTGWCMDYWINMLSEIVMESNDAGCDGLALHTYSRGGDPASIVSEAKMDFPYDDCYNGFRAYRDFLNLVPAVMRALPVFITETDQLDPWVDANSGWVGAAYAEINNWNHTPGNQGIHCLTLYRWQNYDQWGFCDKRGVVDDFRSALVYDYQAPIPSPIPEPPDPRPEPEPPMPDIEWDPRLTVRGCELTVYEAAEEEWGWRCIQGEWFNEQQAQGRVNTFVTLLDEQGGLVTGAAVKWYWTTGEEMKVSEIKNDPWLGRPYSCDFSMYNVAPSYGLLMADGNPSDDVWGMGLGSIEQPDYKIHTAYSFVFQRMKSSKPDPGPGPDPAPPASVELVHPLPAAVITQHWGENGENYARFGMWGHNGCDLGGRPLRTPVRSMADGVVAYSDFDAGYGFYVRVGHRDLDCYIVYCHLDEMGARAGTRLDAGETVGLLGSSGNSTGPHLHIEVRKMNLDGTYSEDTPMPKGRVDPETWCCLHGLKL